MKSNYTHDQIVEKIIEASETKLQNPYRDDVLIRSSKDVVQAIQENCVDLTTLEACKNAVSYFALDITHNDIQIIILKVKQNLLLKIA